MLSNCSSGDDSWGSIGQQQYNQSILKEINPEYSLEGLIPKRQYFGHLVWRVDLLEKTLMLWKTESKRRREWQRARWLNGITDSTDMSLSKLWKLVVDWEVWHLVVHGVAKSWTQLSDWTTTVGWGQSLSQHRIQDDNYENVMNVRRSYLNTKSRLCS